MSQQLLDRAQVGAALQQVRGERVAQRVRRDRRTLAGLEPQPAAHVRGRQAPAALREEQRARSSPAVERPCGRGPGSGRAPARRARRPAPRASGRPCPRRAPPRASGSRLGQVEVHELLRAQAGRVGQLEHGAVAQVERRRGGDPLEQLGHLARASAPRQVGVLLGARDEVGRVRLELAALDQVAVEGADRGQLARHGRLRRAALARRRRRSGAAPGGSASAGSRSRAAAHSASWARSTP